MKALKILFLSPVLLGCLSSCNRLPNKVNTLFGHYLKEAQTITTISTKSDFDSMFTDSKTFVFIQTVSTCECSTRFINQCVNPYIQESGLVIYAADYETIKEDSHGLALRDSAPTFHIILKGNKLGNLEKIDNGSDPFFYEYETFKNYMDEHLAKPFVFKINESILDQLFAADEAFTIYYGRSKCAECEYLQNHLLVDYAQSHFDMKPIYYIDFNDEELDSDKYQLSEKYEWGYGSKHAFPLIHYVEPIYKDKVDAIRQGFTFGNDLLDENYKINKTYYTSERLAKIKYATLENKNNLINNQTFTKDEIVLDGDFYTLNDKANERRYQAIFNEFLDYLNGY